MELANIHTPWKGDFRAGVKIHQNSLKFSILDAFYGFTKVWLFHYSPPHSFQSEKYRLTWDGKFEKFSVLLSLTQTQRGYSGFQVTGMIELAAKIKTQKNPLGFKKKIYPPKKYTK